MADVAVVIGLTMDVLIGLAYERRRRDCAGIAGLTRVLGVRIKRIVVADRECEVTNRRRAEFIGRGVRSFAADPGSELVRQQRGDGSLS